MKTYAEIGANIREARLDKRMTQKELAKAVGFDEKVGDAYIRKVESGQRHPPFERLRLFHEVLGLSYEDLIP